ncbi:hypothetical protein OH492_26215 [Vibrio chagasii]|nr:hypothetical protein [Vibrio chagasii]
MVLQCADQQNTAAWHYCSGTFNAIQQDGEELVCARYGQNRDAPKSLPAMRFTPRRSCLFQAEVIPDAGTSLASTITIIWFVGLKTISVTAKPTY